MSEIQRFDVGTMTVDPTAPSTYRAELCDRLRMRIPEVQDAIAAKLIGSSLGSSVQGEADLEVLVTAAVIGRELTKYSYSL